MAAIRLIIILAIGITLIFIYVRYLEKAGVYFPDKIIDAYPSSYRMQFEDVYFSAEDSPKLNGWFIPHNQARYTLLFFHGNAGNISTRVDKIQLLHGIGLNIFIFDYRGYGKSKGRPSENGVYADAKAAYNYLKDMRKVNPQDLILYGESLGSAVAIDLAVKSKVRAIILEGAFSSGRDMARIIYPFLPRFIFSNLFDSLGKINRVEAAKLFLHARNDEVVPFNLARRLFDAAREPKQILQIPSGGHNDFCWLFRESCVSSIAEFIDKISQTRGN